MCIEDIKALPVGELAAKDCALFLWITFPCLCEALEVLTAWGFSYKTVAFVWVKQNRRNDDLFTGMGYWTRANAEIWILATKGHPKRVDAGVRQPFSSNFVGAVRAALVCRVADALGIILPGVAGIDAEPCGKRGFQTVSYTHLDVYKRQGNVQAARPSCSCLLARPQAPVQRRRSCYTASFPSCRNRPRVSQTKT